MSSIINDTFFQSVVDECPYSCTLLFWGRQVRIFADVSSTIQRFTSVYSRFIAPTPSGSVDITCCIVRRSCFRRIPVLLVGSLLYELPDSDSYTEHAELVLFRHLLEKLDDYIVLHAGVVSRNGRAVVMYGQSGFGKTTLTLELLRRGYGFLSDEFCPVRLSDFMIEPFERLVGLQKTSPFYSLIDQKRCQLPPAEGKVFFDCSDMFPSSPAQPCHADIFIEICGSIDSGICPPGGVVLDICMCCDDTTVMEELRSLPDVTISGPLKRGRYPAYRVTALDRISFVSSFNRIWKDNSKDIFSVFPYKGEIVDYNRIPELRAVPPFEALTCLSSNIVNRSPTGRLLATHGGKTSSLTMLLGRLLKNTSCYSLQPGQLAKTADLIDNLNEERR